MDFSMNSQQKFTLGSPMSLEELESLMRANQNLFPGAFKLKRGILGKQIVFDTYMQVQPYIKVKENVVRLSYAKVSLEVGLGKGGETMVDLKDLGQRMTALKEGGIKEAALGGNTYFTAITQALGQLLDGR